MEKFAGKYRIESNRCQFWDYSAPAHYFITICIENRECILGHVQQGKMILSEFGQIVETEIKKISEYHHRALVDAWVVMPNHIHLIITLCGYDANNGTAGGDVDGNNNRGIFDTGVDKIHEFYLQPSLTKQSGLSSTPTIDEIKQYRKQRRNMLIPKILGKLQQQTSKHINILRGTPTRKNWQHDYYDHVIRDKESFRRIYDYILNNPKKWEDDKFHRE
jgi:REP element-mobilizing transposase RayT